MVAVIGIWGFRHELTPLASEGAAVGHLGRTVGQGNGATNAPIAVMSGLTPTMFITRVSRGAGSNPIISTAWDE